MPLSEWIMPSPVATLGMHNMIFRRHNSPSEIIMSYGERPLSLFEEPLPHSEGLFPIPALNGHDTVLLRHHVAYRIPNATFRMH